MTPREQVKLRLLREWLSKAESDYQLAEHLVNEGALFPNAVAFHCQQAAEKYLKAFLVWHETDFPKTHDLEELLDLIDQVDPNISHGLRDAIELTAYGVELRYPGDRPDVTHVEAREAFELARRVRRSLVAVVPGSDEPG